MSTPTETELDLDSLFLPAWAQQPANKNLYAKYEGREEREPRRDDRGGRPSRPRPSGDRSRDQRGPRPQRQERGGGGGGPRRDFGPRGGRGHEREPERPAPQLLPDVDVQVRPDENG